MLLQCVTRTNILGSRLHRKVLNCVQGVFNLNGAWLQEVIQRHIRVFIALR